MGKETIAQMSPEELREMIEEAVANSLEEKLVELFGDPDEGLVLREESKEKLMKQREAFLTGEGNVPKELVASESSGRHGL